MFHRVYVVSLQLKKITFEMFDYEHEVTDFQN